MDQRGVVGVLFSTALTGGIAALIGATALPEGSAYFATLIAAGLAGLVLGIGGLGALLVYPAGPSASRRAQTLDESQPPPDLDNKERALWLLRRARENAAIARKQWGSHAAQRVYHEFKAAMLGTEREFGCGGVLRLSEDSDEPSYKEMLAAYVAFADVIYPLLQAGLIEQARKASKSFSWNRGWG